MQAIIVYFVVMCSKFHSQVSMTINSNDMNYELKEMNFMFTIFMKIMKVLQIHVF